ncbi:MAG TPA: carboxypeptidase regulatory-like domain-containing protein [Dongiaceae bacterium]|jgi:plastocyanin|nr:carboxypeptidase regulatory-like domain-containing protein [Dongiaceae bacterium]
MTRVTLALLCALAWGPSAFAGEVNGTIDLPRRPAPGVDVDLYGKYDNAKPEAPKDAGKLDGVVFLRAEGHEVVPASLPVPVMDQKNAHFVPRIVVVPAGGKVRFLNSDPMFHNVFSLSPIKKFDLGRYPKGNSKLLSFEHPGVVQVFCDIHAEMIGFVVVVDGPHYAVLDAEGHYRITDVPPGNYDVAVWAEGMSQFRTVGRVSVPANGATEFTASLLDTR